MCSHTSWLSRPHRLHISVIAADVLPVLHLPVSGAGLAALLAVGVFGMGPMYMSEQDRHAYEQYSALSGGPDREGMAVQAPAGAGATLSNF